MYPLVNIGGQDRIGGEYMNSVSSITMTKYVQSVICYIVPVVQLSRCSNRSGLRFLIGQKHPVGTVRLSLYRLKVHLIVAVGCFVMKGKASMTLSIVPLESGLCIVRIDGDALGYRADMNIALGEGDLDAGFPEGFIDGAVDAVPDGKIVVGA